MALTIQSQGSVTSLNPVVLTQILTIYSYNNTNNNQVEDKRQHTILIKIERGTSRQ